MANGVNDMVIRRVAVLALMATVLVSSPTHAAPVAAAPRVSGAKVGESMPGPQGLRGRSDPEVSRQTSGRKFRPGQLVVVVKGDLLGQKARVTVQGLKGKARGVTRTIRVEKRRTIKGLKPGVYSVTAGTITAGTTPLSATVTPGNVRVTAKRGAAVTLRYRPSTSPPGGQTNPGDDRGIVLSSLELSVEQARPGETIQAWGKCESSIGTRWAAQVDGYLPLGSPTGWDVTAQTNYVSPSGEWGPMNLTIPSSAQPGQPLALFAACFTNRYERPSGGPLEQIILIV